MRKQHTKLLSELNVTTLPIPVFDIAKRLGIQVIEYNLGDDVSGVLVIDENGSTIGYNPKDPHVRRRFSVAHEIGHYMLHRTTNELFVDNFYLMKFRGNNSYNSTEYKQEQQANAFAAALLMPEVLIEAELSQAIYTELSETEIIEKLAAKCDVSIAAISYRLTNLNNFFLVRFYFVLLNLNLFNFSLCRDFIAIESPTQGFSVLVVILNLLFQDCIQCIV